MKYREIGSFIEVEFPQGNEYYKEKSDIARLNSGRAAIWHAFRLTGCGSIWIPYYQCETVREFLKKKNVSIRYYHIDEFFNPIDLESSDNEAVLLVNYYGIMSNDRMKTLSSNYKNVIIDNSQAFFSEPIQDCYNVYSARKFIGVPDGAYIIGKYAERYTGEYSQGYSSDTALFLFQRIEYGCEGRTYESRMVNERRIDQEDIMHMSELTYRILDGTDYQMNIARRRENFEYARKLFDKDNKLDIGMYYDKSCVPMIYPLLIEEDDLLKRLLEHKHFQGHWWNNVLNEVTSDTMEYWLSRYMIPVTVDQRYGKNDLDYIKGVVV